MRCATVVGWLVGWVEGTATRTHHGVVPAKCSLVTRSMQEMPQIFHTPTTLGRHPFVATSDIVALQTGTLVVVSLLLSVQEAVVVVVHVFGCSRA
jgi:hypothetical protein